MTDLSAGERDLIGIIRDIVRRESQASHPGVTLPINIGKMHFSLFFDKNRTPESEYYDAEKRDQFEEQIDSAENSNISDNEYKKRLTRISNQATTIGGRIDGLSDSSIRRQEKLREMEDSVSKSIRKTEELLGIKFAP